MVTSAQVKQIRADSGLTQQEFATALVVGISTVQTWEAGSNPGKMASNIIEQFIKTQKIKKS